MKSGNYSSRAMKQGLIKKAGEIIIILVIVIVKRMAILSGLAISTVPIFEVFVIALAFKEVSSILENWMAMGVQLPSFLMKWFKIAQKEAISELTEKDQN